FLDRNGDGRQGRDEAALANVRVELVNDDGEVIASTFTDRSGRYRFSRFPETGDYQVRVVVPASLAVTTRNPQSFLISTGDASRQGLNFGLRLANRTAAGTITQELSAVLAALLEKK